MVGKRIDSWECRDEIERQIYETKVGRKTVRTFLKTFFRSEDGLTIVEYAVAAALITVGVAGAFTALGITVNGVITAVNGLI